MKVKEFDKIQEELENLEDLFRNKKITQKEYIKKHEKLDKKLTSAKNYKRFDSKIEFIKESRKLAKEYAKKFNAPKFIEIVEKEIEHEIEHSKINNKYNLPTTFGFIYWNKPGTFQAFVDVENLSKLTNNWSIYKDFKYDIEILTYPKDPSPGDKKSLKRLKKRINNSNELKDSEKEKLINVIGKNGMGKSVL
ncbi:MAG: hypothetical protein KKG75_00510 [Nanoarchaeota archaeon]|nr:hypothetical protein [Nanoarchaeota archaeon]